jgi:hypothetical protein
MALILASSSPSHRDFPQGISFGHEGGKLRLPVVRAIRNVRDDEPTEESASLNALALLKL